ncbi:ABC transporter substrate-binding protein [Nonomuraea aurantiaca]|uniref:ABC transporter substrate-binding protein n=1 Tax=Nonomuraea aurantiaca TaxID=2878562 RepID=UPI001CD9CDDC|nr:sugar ABC transporter substrate-binding protein [Nonomuraea aurantiaca]MCA2226918.1 sugar ABC transporter substrate-binding protein [Nonomuraea aurantiaca]
MEMNRRQMLALAVAAAAMPALSACGDSRQSKQAAAPVKSGAQVIDPNRPASDDWPFEEAEQLNNSLTWPKTDVPDPASKVVITLAFTTDAVTEVRNAQFDFFFKKRHPNIEIKRESAPFDQFLTKYMAQAAGGTLPDVLYNHYSWTQNLIANKVLQPLDDYIAKTPEFDMNDIPQHGLGYFKRDGKLYGLPTDMAPKLLFYNKDLFDKAGLKYPDESWTWDKLFETAKKMTSGSGAEKIYGVSPMPKPAPDLSSVYLMPYGGRFLDAAESKVMITEPNARDVMARWLDLLLKDKAVPSLAELQLLEKVDPFKSGHAALFLNGAWVMLELSKQKAFKWGATQMPKGPQGRTTPAVGSALVMSASSQNKDAAFIYMHEYLSASGYKFRRIAAPARQSAWEDNAKALGIPAEEADLVKKIMADYASDDGVLRLPANKKVVDTAVPIWERAQLGKIGVDDALKEMAGKVTPVLSENKIA